MAFGKSPEAVVLIDEKSGVVINDDGAAGFFVDHEGIIARQGKECEI